ncbi:unnamed protein product [Cylicostephanus goldi]|uniref:Uncharacterized protein n=1 Tax=Cylicostephanus goldi TaxID=71465 RepID=A0A3P7QRY5_CYLGO|nr:unnamed protein product [Cylicostephanus goldi]
MLFHSLRVGLARLALADGAVATTSRRILCTTSARAPTDDSKQQQQQFDRYTRQSDGPLTDQKKAFQQHHIKKMRDTQ